MITRSQAARPVSLCHDDQPLLAGRQRQQLFLCSRVDNFGTSVAKYLGRHSLKAGFDYRRIKAAGNDANNAGGQYAFNGIFTKSVPTSAGTGGADLADMLLGYPPSGTIYTSSKLTDIANYYGIYIQDDFRVNNKLTFNLGIALGT